MVRWGHTVFATVSAGTMALLGSVLVSAVLHSGAQAQVVVSQPSVPHRSLAMANGIRFEGASTSNPGSVRGLFVMHCAGCHGMDGSGHPAQGVPSMRGALGHFLQLPAGRAFLVQVPGVNNAGLSDAQIADLTNWMVPQFSADTAPPGWAPYRAEEVARYRQARPQPTDVATVRRAVVEQLRQQGLQVD